MGTLMVCASVIRDWLVSDVVVLEYPTGRFLQDARLYAVGAGMQEIQRMVIGREFNNDHRL
jgi:hypothetical protein